MNKKIIVRIKKIKIILTDVDGVLTDGGMYYSEKGDAMKKFHVRDGMAVTLLRKNNISTIIITKEKTKFVQKWAKKMNVRKLYDGIIKKEKIIELICNEFKVKPHNLAYIGDDVNDISLMKKVGFAVAPKDAIKEIKDVADHVCVLKGGEGVFREVADLILENQFGNKKILY